MTNLTRVELSNFPRTQIASIRLVIPRARIGEVMGPAIGSIFRSISVQSIRASGPVLTHHFRIDPEVFDFEVAVPVDRVIADDGEVRASQISSCRVARAVYTGSYEGLAHAWQEFETRLDEMKLSREPNLFERYLRGPESELPPTEWMTELCHVLAWESV
jgi:effector-binding domain-containing protein